MPTGQLAHPGRLGYIPTLDGWRAIAIVLVMLHHDQVHPFLGAAGVWIQSYGFRGVDLFFAISGLLICTRLLEEEQLTGTIALRNFYVRRLFRIQPAVLIYLAALCLLMFTGVLEQAWSGIAFSLLFVRNFLPLHLVSKDYYTGHIWSLSVEEHFYLFLPFFLRRVRNHRASILLACVVILSLWRHIVFTHPSLHFGWSYTFRTDIAVTGILLSSAVAVLLKRAAIRSWCEKWMNPWLVILVVAAVWYDVDRWDHHHFLIFLTFPLLLVSTVYHPAGLPSKLLELAPVRYIGRISYSLYLWQMLFFTEGSMTSPPHSHLLASVQTTWLRYPAVIALAIASYYLVEKPFVRMGHRLAKSIIPGRGDGSNDHGVKWVAVAAVAPLSNVLHR